jgi:hypothetical protein
MRLPILLLALLLAAAAAPAHAAKKEKPEAGVTASSETIKLVEQFTNLETADLPVEAIPQFMAVDVKTLPSKLRSKYQAKKLELIALKKNADGKKKGFFRRMGNDKQAQCTPEEGDEQTVAMLPQMGFEPINEEEEKFLMQKTNCTECELNEEFSLTMYIVPPKKKGEKATRYMFLSQNDPLMGLIASYRSGGTGPTAFFGIGGAGGCR